MFAPFVSFGGLDHLQTALSYNPDTGEFLWRKPGKKSHVQVGNKAGTLTAKGYIRIRVAGRVYAAHRLAWLFVHGTFPTHQIDDINGNRADNRISNLRDVPARVNSENRRRANRNNGTGLLGVSKGRNGFAAAIRCNGRAQHLGTFDSPEQAHEAYLTAKAQLHQGSTL